MEQNITCLRCQTPMQRVKIETWKPGNLFLVQLQKMVDGVGVTIYHCPCCGKLEFFRKP